MIRLNAFFKVKAGVTTAQVKALTDELVELSRKDEGNKGYDLFESTTQPGGLFDSSCSFRTFHSYCS